MPGRSVEESAKNCRKCSNLLAVFIHLDWPAAQHRLKPVPPSCQTRLLSLRLNLLHKSRGYGAEAPLAEDIADHLLAQTMAQADASDAPTTDKVELGDPPVQTSVRIARETWCLGWE
jgi:hypothetical protein